MYYRLRSRDSDLIFPDFIDTGFCVDHLHVKPDRDLMRARRKIDTHRSSRIDDVHHGVHTVDAPD